MPAKFLLRTFGGLALFADNDEPMLVNQRKRLALIAVLAAEATGDVQRERLLAFFWPESDVERARNALNQIVFAIRRDLGDDAIISDASALRLNPLVVESDLAGFRRAIRTDRFADAIAEYRGPFLDGVFLRETPEFERWASDTRDTLAGDYARALEREIDAAANGGPQRAADAVRYARLLAAHDPLSTQNAVRVMRALERTGDTAAALKHAALHSAQVQLELESEPGPMFDREVARLRSFASASDVRHSGVSETARGVVPEAVSVELVPPTGEPEATRQADSQPLAGKDSRSVFLRLAIALAAAALVISPLAATRRKSDAVVVAVETQVGDGALGAVRESILRRTSQLLEGQQRFSTIVVDSVGRDPSAECVVRFYTARCRAVYVVSTRVVRLGDTVSALTTVTVRTDNVVRRDLVPIVSPQADLLAFSTDVAQSAAGAVAALSDQKLPELAAGAVLPRLDAYVEYARGVDQLLMDDWGKAGKAFASSGAHDRMFAAPRTALLAIENSSTRDSAAAWLERHRSTLSARDQAYVAALESRYRGDPWQWFGFASEFRKSAPDDPFALREFADAAFANNYYASADSALTILFRQAGWPARMVGALWAQVDARHDAGDFSGAIETLRAIGDRLSESPNVCINRVVQLAAMGRGAEVDSEIARCATLRDNAGDLKRLGRRISAEDEGYRRAGREYLWHGHEREGQRAFDKAYALERKLFATDTSANNGWLAKELSRDWSAAYPLMKADFGWMYASGPCMPADPRRACISRNRLRFAVTAAHVGDTATALATLRWLDTAPHADSVYKVDRAKVLLALGRREEAMRSLRDALNGAAPGTWMHANTELLELRGDPGFEALISPRAPKP